MLSLLLVKEPFRTGGLVAWFALMLLCFSIALCQIEKDLD